MQLEQCSKAVEIFWIAFKVLSHLMIATKLLNVMGKVLLQLLIREKPFVIDASHSLMVIAMVENGRVRALVGTARQRVTSLRS